MSKLSASELLQGFLLVNEEMKNKSNRILLGKDISDSSVQSDESYSEELERYFLFDSLQKLPCIIRFPHLVRWDKFLRQVLLGSEAP